MDGHGGDAGGEAEFDDVVGEQAQGPAGEALRGVATGEGQQASLELAVEDDLAGGAALGLAAQGGLEAFLDEAFLAAFDRADGAVDRLGDLGDGPAGAVGAAVAEQEHAGGEELLGVDPAGAAEGFEVVAFGLGQGDSIAGWA